MISISLVEDNSAALHALKEKLLLYPDLFIRHEACNGEEILEKLSVDAGVELILMDIEMPVLNGIEATRRIRELYPSIKIIMITIYDNDEFIFEAIQAGADGYILKDTKPEKIYETIRDTLHGGAVMSPSIALKALQILKKSALLPVVQAQDIPELSQREGEVLENISAGLTNKRIAEKLSISPFTVKRHIENIYQKLQARSRVELVAKARRSGLI